MPKKAYQKKRILVLRDILLEHTDEEHSITIDQIVALLREEDLEADKRTIREDILMLCEEYGMDITLPEANCKREYQVLSREFELQEVKLLMDSIQVSKFLSKKTTDELTKKLCKLCSKHGATKLIGQVHRNHVKSDNENIYNSIQLIHEAIDENNPISFKYMEYLPTKKLQARHNDKEYLVYPIAIVYAEEYYYLLANEILDWENLNFHTTKHYRIDHMPTVNFHLLKNLSNIQKNQIRKIENFVVKDINLEDYTKQNFSMYGGNVERVTMRFPNYMTGLVIDRFGIDVPIRTVDNEHFEITESIAVSPQFFGWIFSLGTEVKIIEPERVAQRMKDLLKDTYKVYTIPRNRKKNTESP